MFACTSARYVKAILPLPQSAPRHCCNQSAAAQCRTPQHSSHLLVKAVGDSKPAATRVPRKRQSGPYTLADRSFRSRSDAKQFVGQWLQSHDIGPVAGEDAAWVMAMLQQHPCYEDKVAGGIERFEVDIDKFRRRKCLHIVHLDGTREDFSYRKCLESNALAYTARRAFRSEVMDQTNDFKERTFRSNGFRPLACPISGKQLIYGDEDVHVDHDFSVPGKQFAQLLGAFLALKGMALEEVQCTKSADMMFDVLADRELAAEWGAHHKAHAQLRLLHASENAPNFFRARMRGG